MGIFSQDKTTTNQTAYNQQVATSNRDLTGTQSVLGAGATGNTIINQNLDRAALGVVAGSVHDAISANTATTMAAQQGFQNALSVVAEHQQSAADLATAAQNSTLGQIGVGPQQVVYIVGAIVAGIVLMAYLKTRK